METASTAMLTDLWDKLRSSQTVQVVSEHRPVDKAIHASLVPEGQILHFLDVTLITAVDLDLDLEALPVFTLELLDRADTLDMSFNHDGEFSGQELGLLHGVSS